MGVNYNVIVLHVAPGATSALAPRLERWIASADLKGSLCACWYTEVGTLNRIWIIYRYDGGGMAADRDVIMGETDPFGVGEQLTTYEMLSYEALPGGELAAGNAVGPDYEIVRIDRAFGAESGAVNATKGGAAERAPVAVLAGRSGGLPHLLVIRAGAQIGRVDAGFFGEVASTSELFRPFPFSPSH